MLFTWGMLAGLIFLFAVPQEASSRLQLTYARVFRWPLATGRGITLAARPVSQPQELDNKEYQELQNKVANLQAALQEAHRRNELLAKLREKPGWENVPVQLAPVLVAPDQARNELIISRGKEHGLAVGQFVMSLNAQGGVDDSVSVIGTICAVDATTAKVRLLTDKNSHVAAGIATLNMRCFLDGQGDRTARIPQISKDHKILKGDPVYAQKQPGLDVPTIAARVARCRIDRDNPLFWDIAVEPVCDVAALSDVAVVINTARPQ